MDYPSFTEQQIQERYYSLPENIRDVLESEKEIETIRKICREHHLVDEEKTFIVEQLVGLVLLGFVSADDLSREISENINLNRQHSGDIASEISSRIFSSIKSDLEKIYSPAVAEGKEWGGGAEEVLDLRETETETREVDRSDLSWEVVDLKKEDTPKIIETEKKVLASAASAGEEIIDLGKMDNVAEIPSAEPKMVETKPFDAAQGRPFDATRGEPSRILRRGSGQAAMDEIEPPVVSSSTELRAGEIEPLIIHKEMEIKSVSGFGKKRSLGGLFDFLKKRPAGEIKTEKPPVVQIEIGQTGKMESFGAARGEPGQTIQDKPFVTSEIEQPVIDKAEGPVMSRAESPKIRVVHYGGLRTPISPFGKEAEATTEKKPEIAEKIDEAKQEAKVEKIEIPAPVKQEAPEVEQNVEPEKTETKKEESDEEIIDLRKI